MVLTIKLIVNQSTYKYKMGQSLKSIYDDLIFAFGQANGAWYFLGFVEVNKNDTVFMEEFNKTSFVENANPNIV